MNGTGTGIPAGLAAPVELYVSDVHGEYETFAQVVRGACGLVRRAVDERFEAELSAAQRAELATIVCYPREKLGCARSGEEASTLSLERIAELLVQLCSFVGARCGSESDAGARSLSDIDRIFELCGRVRMSVVPRLHMLGDVYDRGPSPDLVMDEMLAHPAVDVQWGNHDVLWMGACLGQRGSIANVVRICARYGNLSVLEETYGIDLGPLREFAATAYADDPCAAFGLKGDPELSDAETTSHVRIQKAMAIIQFKVEAQLIDENPSFRLEDRKLLHRIDYSAGTVELDGTVHELLDRVFPTVDPDDPYRLTPGEERVVEHLERAFTGCARLHRHMELFLERGSLYRVCGQNLLFHACVPLEDDGSLKEVELFGRRLRGRELFDAVDGYVRSAFEDEDPVARKRGLDMLWYLWLGEGSPLFAKSKMATFELYLVADKAARKEEKNAFYALLDDARAVEGILDDFGMDPTTSRILCGHVPVKVGDGEDPVRCGGRVVMLDGGMSKPYQKSTGIAGLVLAQCGGASFLAMLETFCGTDEAVEQNRDVSATWRKLRSASPAGPGAAA